MKRVILIFTTVLILLINITGIALAKEDKIAICEYNSCLGRYTLTIDEHEKSTVTSDYIKKINDKNYIELSKIKNILKDSFYIYYSKEVKTLYFQESSNLFPIQIHDKYGYINRKGKIIIKPEFDENFDFSEGLARVRIDNKWVYTDRQGKIYMGK